MRHEHNVVKERSNRNVVTEEFVEPPFLPGEKDSRAFVPLDCRKTGFFDDPPDIRFGQLARRKQSSF
jgi:hypothetical protein